MVEITQERVTELVARILGVDPHNVTPTADLVHDLGADSLDTIEFIMAFEAEFDFAELPVEAIGSTVAQTTLNLQRHARDPRPIS